MDLLKKYGKCENHIKELAELYDSGNYFAVVVLAPQVFEAMIDKRDRDYGADLEGKVGEMDENDRIVYGLYERLLQGESIKVRVAGYILHFYQAAYWDGGNPVGIFRSYFNKMDSIFTLRNQLAHEYFKVKIRQRSLKVKARECFDIVDLLLDHHLIY